MIADFDDRFVLPEIPHNCLATGVSRSQNVLNLPVPSKCLDVFWRLLRQDGGKRVEDNLSSFGPRDICYSTAPNHPQKAQEQTGLPKPRQYQGAGG